MAEDMSAGSTRPPEDQFLCSICLDVFTNPVTTTCGHNFCKNCINEHWDVNPHRCPMCKTGFNTKPQLQVNTLLSEMVAQFRRGAQQKATSSSEQQAAEPGEVPCDVCTGTKQKALQSCLVCLTSYCQTHLQPHLTTSRLKRHQLMEPVENLEEMLCAKHDKPLELFCRTDQTCVCSLCSVLDHKTHKLVPLREEYEGKKAELGKTEADIQQMIQKKRLKIQELKESMKISKDAADRETAESVQAFTALVKSIQRGLEELVEEIQAKQKTTEEQAEAFITDLEQEISELMKRSSEMKQLSSPVAHLHFLQSFSSLTAAPPTKDWTEVRVRPPLFEGMTVRAVAQLEENLWNEMKKLFISNRIQKYAVDITLDPDTAHPHIIMSEDGKQAKHQDVKKKFPDNPERFSQCPSVLGKQSFSSGKFYFEVKVQGKTDWTLGVVSESINRKGRIALSPPFGFWTLCLANKTEYKANASRPVRLHLQSPPEKVGVFVDYNQGLVSFYDVDTLIYSFTDCRFTDKLRPYFSPHPNYSGINSAPLIICPVHMSDKPVQHGLN